MDRRGRSVSVVILCYVSLVISGCGFGGPKVRLGSLPTATFGVPFGDPNHLGTHSYTFSLGEGGGIVFACKSGHLDLDHVRGTADLTRYFIEKVQKVLLRDQEKFSFTLSMETSSHRIAFAYPESWYALPEEEKEIIVDEIAYEVGAYCAYNANVWHEFLTWFGVHFAGFEPEFNSAFSWEDLYSNLLGTHLAGEATKTDDYNQAMTHLLDAKLKELQVQPRSVAVHAADKVRGKWYTGNLMPDVKMRNFDIGLDGTVAPVIVEGIDGCDCEPVLLQVPTTEILQKYGIEMTYEIKPNVWESGRIFKAAKSKKIFPEEHFPVLLEYVIKDAEKRGYEYQR